MSISVLPVKILKKTVVMPPLETETPRQEIRRLLAKAVHDRGELYVDRSRSPVSGKDYGCIMGYIMGLKGVPVKALDQNGLDHYIEEFGWVGARSMIVQAIQMNDTGNPWGRIQSYIDRYYPVSA